MKLKRFNNFINEDISDEVVSNELDTDFDTVDDEGNDVTLYRLTSHSVVDLASPGEYYVDSLDAVDPSLLDKPGTSLFLITAKCNSSNIDDDASEKESAKLGNDNIIVVKDDSACEVVSVEPYKK